MNIKYIFSSIILTATLLVCGAFLMQNYNENSQELNGLVFHEFHASTIITTRYLSEKHSLEKTFAISDTALSHLPKENNNAVIQIIIKNNKSEQFVTLSIQNGTTETRIEGLKNRELISFAANNSTKNIPADWAGQLQHSTNPAQNLCLSINAGKICHHTNMRAFKS